MNLKSLLVTAILFFLAPTLARETAPMPAPANLPDNVRTVLAACAPLAHDRGTRELIYQYSIGNLTALSDADAEWTIRELAARGIGVITFWNHGAGQDAGIAEALRIGRIQKKLGLTVACDANNVLYRFYDDTPATAHVDDAGLPFWDASFGGKMGCPFALEPRKPIILARVAAYVEAYRLAGIPIGIVTADWEIDGPHEWNEAWAHSKRCARCRANMPNLDDFAAFQRKMRQLRAALLRDCYADPIISRNPAALVTNYAVYPNDGWRYWYDYFEHPQPELPHKKVQNDLHRPWYDDFQETRFTLAMPVIYTWYNIHAAYPEFANSDYRWFYNMLLVGTNAGKSTPAGIPIATFVHWHTTAPPANSAPVPQMSAGAYTELLWHLLLRGHDIYYSWTPAEELAEEIALIQKVYDASLAYKDWLDHGTPVSFDVPATQGAVISGLRMGGRVLVRRTDFGDGRGPATIVVDGKTISVPAKPGEMQVLRVE